MSEHRATVEWSRNGAEFRYETYPRVHDIRFDGLSLKGTAAPANIPATVAPQPGVDPEQAFVASLSSCHMLWFLHIACRAGYVVDGYVEDMDGARHAADQGNLLGQGAGRRRAPRPASPRTREMLHRQFG